MQGAAIGATGKCAPSMTTICTRYSRNSIETLGKKVGQWLPVHLYRRLLLMILHLAP
jgi:hypothetical protein